jgi:RNA polymerase sigma factor (sigma-70 family)
VAVAPEALAPAASDTAEQLFQEHSRWIYGYCLRILRSPEEAEDALQTTYLNACRSLNQGTRPLVGSAWLLRIAQNVCFARLRSAGRRDRLERLQDIAVLEETVAAPERSPADLIGLTDALRRLPERQREAILLREWQGLSYRELADRLDLTQAATETLIFRARRSLAGALERSSRRSRLTAVHAVDLGGLVAAIKGILAGTAGVKAAAVLTVAVATTTVVTVDPTSVWNHRPQPVPQASPAASKPLHPAAPVAPTSRAPSVAPAATDRRPAEGPSRMPEHIGVVPSTASLPAEKAKRHDGAEPGKSTGRGEAGSATPTRQAHGHDKKPDSPPATSQGRTPLAHGRPDKPPQSRNDGPKPASSNAREPTANDSPGQSRQGQSQGPPPHASAEGRAKSSAGKASKKSSGSSASAARHV